MTVHCKIRGLRYCVFTLSLFMGMHEIFVYFDVIKIEFSSWINFGNLDLLYNQRTENMN